MKKCFFSILIFSLFTLTSCVKEAYYASKLNGDWQNERSYTSFVATKDFTYTDLYSYQWTGPVYVNGILQTNCVNNFNSYYQIFTINPEICLFVTHNAIYYKNKKYDATIDYSLFKSGTIKFESSFMHDNLPITLEIDIKAPVVEMKKDCRYEFNLGSDPAGVPIRNINFNPLHKIKGTTRYDDIIDDFNGTWDISIGFLFLGFSSKQFDLNHVQKYNYRLTKDRLYLSNKVEYSQYHFYGSIPKENIREITYINVFKREND